MVGRLSEKPAASIYSGARHRYANESHSQYTSNIASQNVRSKALALVFAGLQPASIDVPMVPHRSTRSKLEPNHVALDLFVHLPFALLALVAQSGRGEIFTPGQSVPGVSGDVFTWSLQAPNSTFAFWDTFADFPGGSIPGGIAPGTSPAANSDFSIGDASTLTFNSFATIVSSGNAYGFNFAPNLPPVQPEFITDAFATVRSGTSGGDHTRIVAQWQTQGTELATESILLSFDAAIEGTVTPTFSIETEREALGGFGGELVSYMAVWDIAGSQDSYRIDFNAQANHMSFDQFRLDTFTQATAFASLTAVPEPGSFAALGLIATSLCLRRRRRVIQRQ